MGILNVTPDSFSDGGCYLDPSKALDHVDQMVEEGADLIDIGGESTRPGAGFVEEKEEIRRVKPIFEALGRRKPLPLSVDTRKASVAQMALDLGAVMVNDISALRDDPQMGRVIAQSKAGLMLMHMQGNPRTMQQDPTYHDVIEVIKQFLADRLSAAMELGIHPQSIVLDPGIGFGKKVSHNLTIINRLQDFLDLGRPLSVGVSRKSFIGQVLEKPVEKSMYGDGCSCGDCSPKGGKSDSGA